MANRNSRIVIPVYAPSYDGRYWGRYPNGDKPVSGAALEADAAARAAVAGALGTGIRLRASAAASAAAAAGMSSGIRLGAAASGRVAATADLSVGGAGSADILNDTMEDRATGSVSLVSAWTSKGYDDVVKDSTVEITNRAGAPANMLADPRISAAKTRFLHIQHAANEANNRIRNTGLPAGLREMYVSWLEYRPNGNRGGEKWFRCGNFIGGNRGHDIILTLGTSSGTNFNLIANSANMFDYGDQGFGNVIDLNNSMRHYEVRVKLSSGTNSDGIVQVWADGSQIASAVNLRMNRDATDAARNLQLFEIGGWSSTGGGIEPGFTYPIDRWYPGGVKVSTTRLGPWTA